MTPINFYGKARALISKVVHQPGALLNKAIADGMPQIAIVPCRYLIDGTLPDVNSRDVAEIVEARRRNIASSLEGPIEIIYSPKPGSAGDPSRPTEGERLLFSPERVANTGKNAYWGGFLHLTAREAQARSAIELGACAGLSAYYLGSVPSMERLITIEGSAALARIARDTLRPLGTKVHVINALFNDALDELVPGCAPIDFAYIDGHHERVATLTYFERLKAVLASGAVILFDDISWSQDMRDGWNEISRMPSISHCIDLGVVGLCIWEPGATQARIWDLRPIVGVSAVGNPHGWDKKAGEIVD
jgi:hypothetical protein